LAGIGREDCFSRPVCGAWSPADVYLFGAFDGPLEGAQATAWIALFFFQYFQLLECTSEKQPLIEVAFYGIFPFYCGRSS
jgi:hypothetical protein